MSVSVAEPENAPRIIFSALDAAFANELEPRFANVGHAVISNSSAFRMQADVPLIIPEVNPEHLRLLECQASRRKSGGFIVTNPNCSATGLVMALAPLHKSFGIEKIFAVTMQAISGAGYPGVASLDILGNVVPFIAKEEEKMESEPRKLLGELNSKGITAAGFHISAQCNRVPVEDGHTESVSLKLKRHAEKSELEAVWENFSGMPQQLRLPSAPEFPLLLFRGADRPQQVLDVNSGDGMSVAVGGLRPCGLLDWKV